MGKVLLVYEGFQDLGLRFTFLRKLFNHIQCHRNNFNLQASTVPAYVGTLDVYERNRH